MLDQLCTVVAYEDARNKPARRIGRLVKRISSCSRRLNLLADWLLRRWPSNTHERFGSFS